MKKKRRIELFTAGCPLCSDAVALVREAVCPSCEVEVLDMRKDAVAAKARGYGIRSVPAVAIDGRLVPCCGKRGPDIHVLRAAGVGTPLE
ncbi:MAG: hypothetical protein Kow00128_06520 [Deltaproteobacteria bacterium]